MIEALLRKMIKSGDLVVHLPGGRTVQAGDGAVAFMASDAILSFELFKGAGLLGSPRLTAWAIWFLYWGGQVGICWGMLGA